MIKTLAIFTELSKPKLLRAEFYLSPLLQEIEEPALIKKEFLQHFKNFLGTADSNGWGGDTEEIRSLLSHFITDEQGSALVALMTADDVKKTIFLKANKAQGPDGFTAEFFQSSWSIVGKIVTKAILEFLSSFKPTASRLSSMWMCHFIGKIWSNHFSLFSDSSILPVERFLGLFGLKFILALPKLA